MKVRQHWLPMFWPTWRLLLLLALGVWGAVYLSRKLDTVLVLLLFLTWVLLCLNFFWLNNFFKWYLKIYVVTNRRIINVTHSGIFKRQVTEAYLHKVQDVTHKSLGFTSMLLNYGDVIVQTAGHQTMIHFHMVPRSRHIHRQINNLIAEHHSRLAMPPADHIIDV